MKSKCTSRKESRLFLIRSGSQCFDSCNRELLKTQSRVVQASDDTMDVIFQGMPQLGPDLLPEDCFLGGSEESHSRCGIVKFVVLYDSCPTFMDFVGRWRSEVAPIKFGKERGRRRGRKKEEETLPLSSQKK